MSTATKTPTATPTPLSVTRPTAPLPKPAADALARLERTSIAPTVVRAVTQYRSAALHAVELSDLALVGLLSDLDTDSLAHAEDLMAAARTVLADADLLYLVDGHERAKEPTLPQRPRGPHPQCATGVSV